jgi:uncharacterized membrane protein YkvA (DUF1232 family)
MSDLTSIKIDAVVLDMPIEYRDRFQELLQKPTLTVDELRSQVERYTATVKRVSRMVRLLDIDRALALSHSALSLIDLLKPEHPPAVKMLIQAAVHYFIFEEEDEEVTGVLGFDDDVWVMNAVSKALGRMDLVLPIKRRT